MFECQFVFSRLPVFVQIHSKSQQLYLGIYENKNFRTDFEMVHLNKIPPPCNYLTGKTLSLPPQANSQY